MLTLIETTPERAQNHEHMQTSVSVEMATQLQNLSMTKFQTEAALDIKLRRMIGHVSINRRSTEIIRTATFMEDVFDELEEETMYDEDAITCDVLIEETRKEIASQISESELEIVRSLPHCETLETPVHPVAAVVASTAERYQPTLSDIAAICAESEFLTQIDEDWMYNVLDLRIDLNSVAIPVPASQLPPSLVIQFWRQILASLSELAKSRAQHKSIYDASQLEAYGLPANDQLVGLGLQCHSGRSESFNPGVQLAT